MSAITNIYTGFLHFFLWNWITMADHVTILDLHLLVLQPPAITARHRDYVIFGLSNSYNKQATGEERNHRETLW